MLERKINFCLNHWGRVTHICVSKLTIIGSDNGLSPDRCQAIIWTNDGILLIGPLETNFCEILFSFKKMRLKVSSAKRRPSCLGLNVLKCLLLYYNTVWAYLISKWSDQAYTSDQYFSLLWYNPYLVYLLHFMFTSDKCHRRSAVVTSAEYYWHFLEMGGTLSDI